MHVRNRQGLSIDVSFDEIKKRILRLCDDDIRDRLDQIDVDRVVIQTINGIYDGITTSELDDLSARICASMQSVHFLYDMLAARIVVSNMAKNVRAKIGADACASFSAKVAYLGSHPEARSTLHPDFVDFVARHAERIDALVRYERDVTHSYFSLRTLERSYLMRLDDLCVESPQDMWMRVAVAIHMGSAASSASSEAMESSQDPEAAARAAQAAQEAEAAFGRIAACYEAMSTGEYTHATPTLFNAGMRVQQCSSCFVGDTQVATVDGGVKRIRDVVVGDRVVTHLGNVRTVAQVHRNPLGGRELYDLRVDRSRPVVVTGNHRFWVVPKGQLEGGSPRWVRADALIPGDLVGIPCVRDDRGGKRRPPHRGPEDLVCCEGTDGCGDTSDTSEGSDTDTDADAPDADVLDVVDFLPTGQEAVDDDLAFHGLEETAERYWRMDNDFARLAGAYLRGGRVLLTQGRGMRPRGVCIDLVGDTDCVDDAEALAARGRRVTGVQGEVLLAGGKWTVRFLSRVVGVCFDALFGPSAADARLPPKLFSQGAAFVDALLQGYHGGPLGPSEGPLGPSETPVDTPADTPFGPLAIQLYHLCRMHGIVDPSAAVSALADFLPVVSCTLAAATEVGPVAPEFVYTLGIEEDDHSYSVEGLLAENCYLLGTDDSLQGIFKTLSDCAQISKWAGGIGLHVSNVRAKGSRIGSTNGTSDGIVPMLKVFNECARYCNQSGRRKGSIAVYLEPWHADVWEFVELRRNTGSETERTRDLFLALWIPDEFMRRLEADEDWFLMTPDACPGLIDAVGDAFATLYAQYVAEGRFVRKVRARSLWQHVLQCQLETGVPYVMFKDSVNRKCNQSNVGVVRSSNLCAEITEVSDSGSYAVCNLASIAVNRFVRPVPDAPQGAPEGAPGAPSIEVDHARLHEAAKRVTLNLNRVIDINTYPTPETESSNMSLRPIGIGIQGMGDLYCMLKLPYEDERAMRLDAEVMETIYHGAVEASVELAEADGAYPLFAGSPASEGRLQMDLWTACDSADGPDSRLSGRYDWAALRARVAASGLRNSLLTALMPTASTSQILGNCESFEPFQANVFKRSTIAGEFVVVNRHLMRDLMAAGLWDEAMRRALLASDGSVQSIEGVPDALKAVYRTVWEVSQRSVIDHAVARGPFVDQSQSMNLYFASPSFNRLSSALTYAWKSGLKTGMYYLRSMAAVEAIKYGAGGAGGAQQAGTPRGAGGGTKGMPLTAAASAASAAAAFASAAPEATPSAEKGTDDAERVCKLRRIGGKPEEECIMCSS